MLILNGIVQPHLAATVGRFAELPDARGRTGAAYRVQRASGILPRRAAGVYLSDGKKWRWVLP